jgi:hypothetical protein
MHTGCQSLAPISPSSQHPPCVSLSESLTYSDRPFYTQQLLLLHSSLARSHVGCHTSHTTNPTHTVDTLYMADVLTAPHKQRSPCERVVAWVSNKTATGLQLCATASTRAMGGRLQALQHLSCTGLLIGRVHHQGCACAATPGAAADRAVGSVHAAPAVARPAGAGHRRLVGLEGKLQQKAATRCLLNVPIGHCSQTRPWHKPELPATKR